MSKIKGKIKGKTKEGLSDTLTGLVNFINSVGIFPDFPQIEEAEKLAFENGKELLGLTDISQIDRKGKHSKIVNRIYVDLIKIWFRKHGMPFPVKEEKLKEDLKNE